MNQEEAKRIVVTVDPVKEAPRHRIMIVDDVPANIRILGSELRSTYDILIATSGEQAIQIAADEKLDMILLDIMMPGMDGYDVCTHLKSERKTADIPVIFITAKDDENDEMQGLALGAVDYITKPFSVPIVKARIRTHLELKKQRDFLESLSLLDGLTGIPNRRRFDEVIKMEWRRAARSKSPLSLIMIDVDFFKQFNDTYGHGGGDECLRRIATAIVSSLARPSDFAARYGGEEFVVVLPGADESGALAVSENIRKKIRELGIPHEGSNVADHVTLSLGIAGTCPSPESPALPDALSENADRMLYEAKSSGRNRAMAMTF